MAGEIGAPFKRLNDLLETAELMLDLGEPPAAKWLDFGAGGGSLRARACPLFASGVLRRHLWPLLRGAVITSAMLRALGRFDFFEGQRPGRLSPACRPSKWPAPLTTPPRASSPGRRRKPAPSRASEHTAEVASAAGAGPGRRWSMVRWCCALLVQLHARRPRCWPVACAASCMQGESAREQLLRAHRAAVERGERSILVGLQSFGEGLDLPGQQCEWVFMPKLPFLTPDDPVQKRAPNGWRPRAAAASTNWWCPRIGVRLNQWAGRGIRSEQDHAHIVCYDGRLASTPFGRQLLAGLPGFMKKVWRDGVETPI
ncbi:MAG: helicase C-terminal domain-containing protein [Inhella sp.]